MEHRIRWSIYPESWENNEVSEIRIVTNDGEVYYIHPTFIEQWDEDDQSYHHIDSEQWPAIIEDIKSMKLVYERGFIPEDE